MKRNNKGKTIGTWVNQNDQIKLIERFGELPDSKFILSHLLNEPVMIQEIDKNTDEILFQLKKIGNNLNQIVLKINQNVVKYSPIYEESIFKCMEEIKITMNKIVDFDDNNIVERANKDEN